MPSEYKSDGNAKYWRVGTPVALSDRSTFRKRGDLSFLTSRNRDLVGSI